MRARVYFTVAAVAALLVGAAWLILGPISHSLHHDAAQLVSYGVAVGAFAILLGVVVSEALIRSLEAPVRDLQRVVTALAAGDQSARIRNVEDDELGELSRTVDRMATQIGARLDAMSAEEAQLRTILDSMVEAVFVTDPEGRIILTNAALQRLAGARVEGRTAVEAIRSPELHDAVALALRGVESSVQIETRMATESRVLAAHISPLPQGSGVVTVLHDVTDLKLADTVRRDFVANASHELRTPLTAIRGFAETLAGGVQDPVLVSRFVGRILEHSVRMQRLVDDLMQLSRAEAPDETFVVEPIDLSTAVARALRSVEAAAAKKRIKLQTDQAIAGVRVLADERALDHVLINLADNGVKYTPEEGSVTVRLRAAEDGWVYIEVADTGGGIAAPHLSRIFERFYRVDPGRSRDVGGTGLGLAIVKHLTQRMGGEVSVESSLGVGTVFRVKLRVARAES